MNYQHVSLTPQKALLGDVLSFFGGSDPEEADMLTYRCAAAARIVHSGIKTSETEVRRLSAFKLSLWCPYCQTGHAILGKDMQVIPDIVA
jgi:hypothetical protein